MAMTSTTLDPVRSLGEDFTDTGFCDVWKYYPHGELFAVTLPYSSICEQEGSNGAKEAVFMLEATMYFGLVFLLVIMLRSTSSTRIDWYRLIAFYLVGTIGVPLSNEFGADAAGFNRFIGFGVLVHNMAEAAILAVIWRGTQNKGTSRGVRLMIVYFWLMLVLITFLDLHILLFVSSFQGATMDFFLVTSFCTIAVTFGRKGKYFWIAFAASLLHILTIQPLFLGMMLGWGGLSAPTVIFLVPTFMLYIWFASADPRAELTIAQQKEDYREASVHEIAMHVMQATQDAIRTSTINTNYGNFTRTKTNTQNSSHHERESSHTAHSNKEDSVENFGGDYLPADIGLPTKVKSDSTDNRTNSHINSHSGNNLSQIDSGMVKSASTSNGGSSPHGHSNNMPSFGDFGAAASGPTVRTRAASAAAVAAVAAARRGTDIQPEVDMDEEFDDEDDTIALIVQKGLFNTKHFPNAKKAFKRALFFAVLGAALDECFLVIAPCVIDTSFLCD